MADLYALTSHDITLETKQWSTLAHISDWLTNQLSAFLSVTCNDIHSPPKREHFLLCEVISVTSILTLLCTKPLVKYVTKVTYNSSHSEDAVFKNRMVQNFMPTHKKVVNNSLNVDVLIRSFKNLKISNIPTTLNSAYELKINFKHAYSIESF